MIKVTHVNFQPEHRTIAVIRAAQRKRTLSQYLTDLVLDDARQAGLLDYLGEPAHACDATQRKGGEL